MYHCIYWLLSVLKCWQAFGTYTNTHNPRYITVCSITSFEVNMVKRWFPKVFRLHKWSLFCLIYIFLFRHNQVVY